ncbi:MAG: hypothetical protein R3Y11_00370 [Pseudomonadota bacterium]
MSTHINMKRICPRRNDVISDEECCARFEQTTRKDMLSVCHACTMSYWQEIKEKYTQLYKHNKVTERKLRSLEKAKGKNHA